MPPENKPDQVPTPPVPSGGKPVDIGSILLPTKEVHSPASAQRVNAGVLLEQEQNASATLQSQIPQEVPRAKTPEPAAVNPNEIAPVETYQGDIEKLVKQNNVSNVNIAAAEAVRRSTRQVQTESPEKPARDTSGFLRKLAFIGGGAVMLLASIALVYVVYTKLNPPISEEQTLSTPFVRVDTTSVVPFASLAVSHSAFMSALTSAVANMSLPLGLLGRIAPTIPNTDPTQSGGTLMSAQTLLSNMSPSIPPTLLRTIHPSYYLLGVHSFDGDQPFLLLHVDSYELAFSGMLDWENSMSQELKPLFNRIPKPRVPQTTVGTSSPTSTPSFIQTGFVDTIIENHDARALKNQDGDLLLLWTFLDSNTLLITTNEYTIREISTRLVTPATTVGGK